MKKMTLTALFVAALFGFAAMSQAHEDAEVPADAKEVKMQKVAYVPATSVTFRETMKLNFPSLTTLGARIEAARQSCDPVTLAVCGLELQAAEVASGKTAAMTSKQVLDEAFNLAFQRAVSAELKAVKVLIPEKKAAIDKLIAMVEEPEAARGFRYLHVTNKHQDCMDIFINGSKVGHVESGRCGSFASGRCPHHTMTVIARCDDGDVHASATVNWSTDTYHFTIWPD